MVQNEGPERTGVRTFGDVRAGGGVRVGPRSRDGEPRPAELSPEDAAAVLQALDPFWTRGIVPR
jgi:hypothetical protein